MLASINIFMERLVEAVLKIDGIPTAIRNNLAKAQLDFAQTANAMSQKASASYAKIGQSWKDLMGVVQDPRPAQSFQNFFLGLKQGWTEVTLKMNNFYQFGIEMATRAAQTMEQAFSDFFFDGFTTGFKNMQDLVASFGRSILRMLADIIARAIMTRIALSAIGATGSIFGSVLKGVAGIASLGAGAAAGAVSSSAGMFTGVANGINSTTAGLGSFADGTDFVPSTGLYRLHQGEKVLTKSEANVGGGSIELKIFNMITPEAIATAMSGKEGEGVVVNAINRNSLRNGVVRREVKRR